MRKSTKDILSAVFCLLCALAFQVQTGDLEGISLYFPRILLIFITVLSLVLLGNALLAMRKEQRAEDEEPTSWFRIGLISAGSIVYVAAMPLAGFYPTSAVFLFGMAWLLRDKATPARKVAFAAALFTIVLCLAVWGGFTLLLNVPTPESLFLQE